MVEQIEAEIQEKLQAFSREEQHAFWTMLQQRTIARMNKTRPQHDERMENEEVWERGEAWYDNHLKDIVETEKNIGKFMFVDVLTGDYEISEDPLLPSTAYKRLLARKPDAIVHEIRIGYDVAHVIGRHPRRRGEQYKPLRFITFTPTNTEDAQP